ncbi:MAG: mglC [Xanthobacteraceae bacterium]|jgi:inositol transport system permease protein|nr:mglC [Xanthobacteraceae bacterium]
MTKEIIADGIPEQSNGAGRWRRPQELNIFLVLVGIVLLCEVLGWLVVGQSFVWNPQRLTITILQVSVVGIIAIGVTQVIITGGIDLSSGSVVAATAMFAAGFAQAAEW